MGLKRSVVHQNPRIDALKEWRSDRTLFKIGFHTACRISDACSKLTVHTPPCQRVRSLPCLLQVSATRAHIEEPYCYLLQISRNRIPMKKSTATEPLRVASEVAAIRAALYKRGYRIRKQPKQPIWKVFVSPDHFYLLTYQPAPISGSYFPRDVENVSPCRREALNSPPSLIPPPAQPTTTHHSKMSLPQ